jgi:hypothetical protein
MDGKVSINDLIKLRKIIFLIIDVLENNINDFSNQNAIDEKNLQLMNFLIGDKETVVSIITKLVNSLTKVIPLEEKFSSISSKDDKTLDKFLKSLISIGSCKFLLLN